MTLNMFQAVRGTGSQKEHKAVFGNGQTKEDLQTSGEWIAIDPDAIIEVQP